MRRIGIVVVFLLAASSAARAGVDLVVAPETRTHREHITASPHTFTLRVDADDIRPFSKHAVVDDVLQWVSISGPAANPRLEVDGMPDLRSAETLLASILKPGMSDTEKALAIHTVVARFSVYTSPPRTTWGLDDPVIALNSAAGICGNITVWTKSLAWKAGFPARTYEITGHTVPEIFYNGRWHMFDPTTWTFYIG
ncbi:MAG TPA: transglutaminase domain-containing protein, partial [Planctomycetota bacterium]|nr:transglutaminase domain-containing protein [Planctomycetota bacterium]